jgi:hypothetical protein
VFTAGSYDRLLLRTFVAWATAVVTQVDTRPKLNRIAVSHLQESLNCPPTTSSWNAILHFSVSWTESLFLTLYVCNRQDCTIQEKSSERFRRKRPESRMKWRRKRKRSEGIRKYVIDVSALVIQYYGASGYRYCENLYYSLLGYDTVCGADNTVSLPKRP